MVRDFFSFVFRDTPVTLAEGTRQNETLSLEDMTLIRHMHRALRQGGNLAEDVDRAFGWFFADVVSSYPYETRTKVGLHKELAGYLKKTFAEDAAALDALVFDGALMTTELARAEENALDRALSFDPQDHHSPQALRHASAFAEFLSRIAVSDPAHFRWAVRPQEFREPLSRFLQNERERMAPAANPTPSGRETTALGALKARLRRKLL